MTHTRFRNSTEENCFYVIFFLRVSCCEYLSSQQKHMGRMASSCACRDALSSRAMLLPSRPPRATDKWRAAVEALQGSGQVTGSLRSHFHLDFSSITSSTHAQRGDTSVYFVSFVLLPKINSLNLFKLR